MNFGRIITALLAGAGIASSTSPASAQFVPGTPYQLTRGPNTFVELPNPTILTTNASGGQFPIALPFPVPFYNTSLTTLSVGVAGAIAFPQGTFVSTANQLPGSTSSPSGFIAPSWDGLWIRPGTPNTRLAWQVQGTAPNRTVTFEWLNVDNFSTLGSLISMQVRFHEGLSGRIDIDYGPATGVGFWSSTMGMEDQNNGRPIYFATSGCTSNCTVTDFVPNTRITLVQDPGIELFAQAANPPAIGFLGAQLTIPVVVQNLHSNPLGPFMVEVSASATADLVNAVPMGTAEVFLSGFQRATINVPCVPPISLGEGNFYVGLTVDSTGVINEVNENNNTVVSTTQLRLVEGAPDLAVQRVVVDTTAISAGDSVVVTTRIENIGGEPANNVDVSLMLSTNSVISPQDLLLDTFTVSLAPSEMMTVQRTVTVDANTQSGVYYVGALADPMGAIMELNESNNGRAADDAIIVTGGALAIVTGLLPSATFRVPYAATLTAVGGTAADRRWDISAGSLPAGLGIAARSGEIFGRPTMLETQTFTVRVTSGAESATKQLTIIVVDPTEPLTIVTKSVAKGVVGEDYAFPIIATGGAQMGSLTWSAQNLPAGFVVTEQGVLGGTTDVTSSSTITVSVTDGTETASVDLVLDILANPNLLIVPRGLPPASFNQPYREQLESTGGVLPIIWVVDSGELPPGMNLSTSGEISGTPQGVGLFRFVAEIRDSQPGSPARDANMFLLEVTDDGALTIATARLPDGVVGQGYDGTLDATGGLPPYRWTIAEGRVPDGLIAQESAVDGNFKIRGQPSEAGTSNFLIQVSDAQGRVTVKAFSLRVLLTAPVTTPVVEEGGCSCASTMERRPNAWLLLLVGGLFLRRRR